MTRRALAGFLQDFSGRTASGESAPDRAELARLAGRAEALQEARLLQEQVLRDMNERHARELAETREAWIRSEAARIDEAFALMRRGLSTELSALVADCLRPFLSNSVREAALQAFADEVHALLAREGATALTISGPADLLAALSGRLGPAAAQCVLIESERVALEAPLPDALAGFLTRLSANEEKDYGETF